MPFDLLLAVFADPDHAAFAGRAVHRLGVPSSQISRHRGLPPVSVTPDTAGSADALAPRGFLWRLFGWDAEASRIHACRRHLPPGGALLVVRVLEEEADRVRDLLDRLGGTDAEFAAAAPPPPPITAPPMLPGPLSDLIPAT